MISFFVGAFIGGMAGIGVAYLLRDEEDGELSDKYQDTATRYEDSLKDCVKLRNKVVDLYSEKMAVLKEIQAIYDGLTYKDIGRKKMLDDIISKIHEAEQEHEEHEGEESNQ